MTVHNTKEGLIKDIPCELLPEEYVPDSHTGEHCGSTAQIIGMEYENLSLF